MERYGEIILLKELHSCTEPMNGKYVRITGFIEEYDPIHALCRIQHENFSIIIDLELITAVKNLSIDILGQFIGELRPCHEKKWNSTTNTTIQVNMNEYYLKARVFRNVTGLDLKLYVESLYIRRKFLQVIIIL